MRRPSGLAASQLRAEALSYMTKDAFTPLKLRGYIVETLIIFSVIIF